MLIFHDGLSGEAILLKRYLTFKNPQVKYVPSRIIPSILTLISRRGFKEIASKKKYFLNVSFYVYTHTQAV